ARPLQCVARIRCKAAHFEPTIAPWFVANDRAAPVAVSCRHVQLLARIRISARAQRDLRIASVPSEIDRVGKLLHLVSLRDVDLRVYRAITTSHGKNGCLVVSWLD